MLPLDYEVKKDIVHKIEDEYGIDKLFKLIGLIDVSKKGKNVYCVCPFHAGGDNPTGFVYSNGFGYCFTHCNKKFDLYSIVMKAMGYEFLEALEFLANLVGVQLDYHNGYQRICEDAVLNRQFLSELKKLKNKKQRTIYKPLDIKILDDFEPRLHRILREEGFDDEVRNYFGLGFAQSGYMENRITIPIYNVDGTLATISGRSVLTTEQMEAEKVRRYQNWFNAPKSATLYNINNALPSIKEKGEVFVFEGFKSVWRLHQWGIRNVVAVMGDKIEENQKKLLINLTARIVICGDRDKAGKELNLSGYNELKKYADVEIMDMYLLDVSEKSSIDNITKEQFQFIYKNRK